MEPIIYFEEWHKSEPLSLNSDDLNFLKKSDDDETEPKIGVIEEDGSHRLSATSWVGTIKIPSYTITIKPKIGSLNFFKMVEYLENLNDINFQGRVSLKEGEDFADLISRLFIDLVNEVIEVGLYKNYATVEEEISTIRGKLLATKNIKKPRISQEKFWCEYDEIGYDTLENQALLYCSRILSWLVVDKSIRKKLGQIQHVFEKEGVTEAFLDPYHLDMIHYQKFNEHYENVLKLCEFILRSLWYGDFSKEGPVPAYGFLCNMHTLFQNFITKILQAEFSQFIIKKNLSNNELLKDVTPEEINTKQISSKTLKPDIVIQDKKTRDTILIIDTKYKKNDPTANDIYQSVAYSLAFNCPVMLLLPQLDVRKRGDFELIDELGKNACIFARTVDLSESNLDYVSTIKNRLKNIIEPILDLK